MGPSNNTFTDKMIKTYILFTHFARFTHTSFQMRLALI